MTFILPDANCPILLIYGENDLGIQILHSETLFDAMLALNLELGIETA